MDARARVYFEGFLRETGRDPGTACADCFHFELTEKWANELLRLVLIGQKRATCSSMRSFEIDGEALPKPGDLSVVTDWDGNPRCVIETTQITIMKFSDMTYDICQREGEDECLETWRDGHARFFTAEGKETGYEFSEDMEIVFEDFKVVYR